MLFLTALYRLYVLMAPRTPGFINLRCVFVFFFPVVCGLCSPLFGGFSGFSGYLSAVSLVPISQDSNFHCILRRAPSPSCFFRISLTSPTYSCLVCDDGLTIILYERRNVEV